MVVSVSDRTERRLGQRRRESPSTLAEVGAELRQARERLGASLVEVHEHTGLSWRELDALETGDLRRTMDRQGTVVGLHRYAAYLGLDGCRLARVLNEPSEGTRHLSSIVGGSTHFSEDVTAPIPRIGPGAPHPEHGQSRRREGSAPLVLRVAVWLVAILLVVGGGSLATTHGVARWLGDIRWGPSPTPAVAASQDVSATIGSSSPTPVAVLAPSGAGSVAVSVRALQFGVLVKPTAPCWVRVTTSSSATPLFVGVLPPGDNRTFDAANGRLSVEIGAGGVTLELRVRGHAKPGWSFKPSVAPLTLNFTSASHP